MIALFALGCVIVYGQAEHDCSKALHVINNQFVENGVFVRSGGSEGPPFQPGNAHNTPYSMTVLQASSAPVVYPVNEGCDLPPGVAVQFVFQPHAVKISSIACSYAFDGNTNIRVGNRRDNRCIPRTMDAPDLNSLQPPNSLLQLALHARASTLGRVDLVTGKVYSSMLLPHPGEVDLNEFTAGVEFEAIVHPTNAHTMTFSAHDILALAVVHAGEMGTVPPSVTAQQVRACARRQVEKPATVWLTQFNPNKFPILEFSSVAAVQDFEAYVPFVARYLLDKRRYTQPSTYFSCFHRDNPGSCNEHHYDDDSC